MVFRLVWPDEEVPQWSTFDRSWLNDQDLFREDLFVGGRWRSGGTGRRIDVTDPATGAVIGRIAEADETDVRDAIAAAAGSVRRLGGLHRASSAAAFCAAGTT